MVPLSRGVVSGTIVAMQLQLLRPAFRRLVGQLIALPFAIEIVAFVVEAAFAAIGLYAGGRLRPGLRIFSALLVAVGAAGSGVLITDVNAFMNTPAGFHLQGGQLIDIQPWRAVFNPSMPTEIAHVPVTAHLAAFLGALWSFSGRNPRAASPGRPRWAVVLAALQFALAVIGYGAAHAPYLLYPQVATAVASTGGVMFSALRAAVIVGVVVLVPARVWPWRFFAPACARDGPRLF